MSTKFSTTGLHALNVEGRVRDLLETVCDLDVYQTITSGVALPNSWQVTVPETGGKVRITLVKVEAFSVEEFRIEALDASEQTLRRLTYEFAHLGEGQMEDLVECALKVAREGQ